MTMAVDVGSCFMRSATSSRIALAMLVRRAEPGSKWISSVRISVGTRGGATGASGGGIGNGGGGAAVEVDFVREVDVVCADRRRNVCVTRAPLAHDVVGAGEREDPVRVMSADAPVRVAGGDPAVLIAGGKIGKNGQREVGRIVVRS